MKTLLRTFLAVSVLFCSATLLRADQPHMKEAVELLKRAQGAEAPVPLLRAAKKELEVAEDNKGGYRVEAIKIVNHAIEEGELGHRVKMDENVAAAITAIRDGMARAR